jgi:hypothetical protein
MHDELESQLGSYYNRHGQTYEEILSKTKWTTNHMQATKHIDPYHIDYDIPQHDPEKLRQYTQFIARECKLQKINIQGAQLEEWRLLLRQSVAMEKYISYLLNVCKWKNEGRKTVSIVEVVELLIPCDLHLENRVGEKLIAIILRKGLDTY